MRMKHEERIVDRSELIKIAQTERTNGKRIVFANGCFDVLHVGHVRYLESAKTLKRWGIC